MARLTALAESIDAWQRDPYSRRGRKVQATLTRYFARMSGRPTPFGMFAGYSGGGLARRPASGWRRDPTTGASAASTHRAHARSRPQHVPSANCRAKSPARANPTIYRAGERIRFVTYDLTGARRVHRLSSVAETWQMAAALDHAREDTTIADLSDLLAERGMSAAAARRYVHRLIERRLLLTELEPPATGPDPARHLLERLRRHRLEPALADGVEAVSCELAAIDDAPPGVARDSYDAAWRACRRRTRAGVAEPSPVQVDLLKPAPGLTPPPPVLEAVAQGVDALDAFAVDPVPDRLAPFRTRFRDRYEDREVPLLEALDEDAGVGLPDVPEGSTAGDDGATRAARDRLLLRKLLDAERSGADEIAVDPRDLILPPPARRRSREPSRRSPSCPHGPRPSSAATSRSRLRPSTGHRGPSCSGGSAAAMRSCTNWWRP